MNGPLLFNPARASVQELERTFVGRWQQLETLERDLIADAGGPSRRHWQLIGPRGSGKSHFTELLSRRLMRDHGWDVVRLPEEHYQVASVGELLEQIVVLLEHAETSPFAQQRSPRDVEELALQRIRNHRLQRSKPILVVLENLGILLGRQLSTAREQSRLREILMRDPPFTLVTTSTSYVDEASRHDAPFYDFFQIVTLEDLSRADVAQLVEARATWDGDAQLLGQMEQVRQRIDAIFHFSGGNPRLVLALYGILRRGVTEELNTQLLKLLDEVTPYYQSRLGDVSPQMVRVLTAMALADRPTTPAEIARVTRLSTTQVTANISKLTQERFVRPGGRPDKRRRYYEVMDRLFRLWLQMREGGAGRRRLRFLTEFFRRWYGGKGIEVLRDASRVADVFWQEIRGEGRRRCPELLSTLEYLGSALSGENRELIIESLAGGLPASGATELLAVVPHLESLAGRLEDGAQRSAVNLMLARAYSVLGQTRHAREAFARVSLNEAALGENGLSLYLMTLAKVAGIEEAYNKGLGWLPRIPAMKYCQLELSEFAAWLGDVANAKQLFEAYLGVTKCPDCRRIAYRRIVLMLLWAGANRDALALARRALEDAVPDAEARALVEIARWKTRKSREVDELANVLRFWANFKDVPADLVYELACAHTHYGAPLEALRLIRAVEPRSGAGFWVRYGEHIMESLVRLVESGGIPSDVMEWLLNDQSNREALADRFCSQMPRLARSAPKCRPVILKTYRMLADRGLLPGDLEPYSSALYVIDAPDREKGLAALHPEMREAVSFLLGNEQPQAAQLTN